MSFDFTISLGPEWGYLSMVDTISFHEPLKLLAYELWPIICGKTHWQAMGEEHVLEAPDNLVGRSSLQNLYFHISAVVVYNYKQMGS